MKVRLEAMLKHKKKLYPKAKFVRSRYILSKKYFDFLSKRTKTQEKDRRKMVFYF
jgi:UTP-glucose-1-phosphate uridylyltransferase